MCKDDVGVILIKVCIWINNDGIMMIEVRGSDESIVKCFKLSCIILMDYLF